MVKYQFIALVKDESKGTEICKALEALAEGITCKWITGGGIPYIKGQVNDAENYRKVFSVFPVPQLDPKIPVGFEDRITDLDYCGKIIRE